MEKETGAKIYLRGKESARNLQKPGSSDNEDLHVLVEADNKKSLDAAVAMIEKLLIPVSDGENDHKRAQLSELAKLNGTYKDEKPCKICKEYGHREYACPQRKSTFKRIPCNSCGSFCHLVSNCPLFTASQVCKPSWSSSGIDVTNLYVGYLPHIIDSNRLKELFLPFGKIIEGKGMKDQNTGLSKGYGFVKFDNPTDAASAVSHMNGHRMGGNTLAIRVAVHVAVADYSPLSNHAVQSGPVVASSGTRWQGASPPLPVASMLPAQSSFLNNETLDCPPSTIYLGHDVKLPKSEDEDFSPVGSVVTLMPSSYEYPNQIPVGSAVTLTPLSYEYPNQIPNALKFPGDPDYLGSQTQS